jgi:cytochrome c oxidase subunit 1
VAGSPRVLDNLKIWTAIAAVLILIAYGFPLWDLASDGLLTPGMPPIPV